MRIFVFLQTDFGAGLFWHTLNTNTMQVKILFRFFILFFLIALSQGVRAQKEKSLWIDARAGLNTSFIVNQNAYGNGELDYATTFGLTAGLGASYYLTYTWGFSAAISWAKLGQNYSGLQSSGDATRKVKLNYLCIPLLAMRKIGSVKKHTWFGFGPELMFLTGAKQEYHRKNGGPLPKPDFMKEGLTDIKERFSPVDVALKISLNKIYDVYQNRNYRLFFSANMAMGLVDMNKKSWHTPNMHGVYAGSHNFYMGITAAVMYQASVK
jgi:hypothetical protein